MTGRLCPIATGSFRARKWMACTSAVKYEAVLIISDAARISFCTATCDRTSSFSDTPWSSIYQRHIDLSPQRAVSSARTLSRFSSRWHSSLSDLDRGRSHALLMRFMRGKYGSNPSAIRLRCSHGSKREEETRAAKSPQRSC